MSEPQPVKASVDQISEGGATLLLGEDESVTVRVPLTWLPKPAKEGVVVQVHFEVDEQATQEGKRQVQELLDGLGGQP